MALDLYTQDNIKRVLAGVLVAQQPGQEGCRSLVAVALAFGCIQLPKEEEQPQVTARQLLQAGDRAGDRTVRHG